MEGSLVPRKLAGRYEVREVLGKGGMGLVYRAYDTVIRREVAVKTILDIPDPAALQLFYRECDVLASMSHPNIVEIFDIGEFEEEGKKKPYFVMPLLPGTTLETFIRKASHRLTVERTVGIISQACRGLQAAHERGLVHRDLKPSNIFVMEDDSVKIIDFGVALITETTHSTRALKGTLLYMSPEQIEMKPLTSLSDIFSLSVVCYEALTGRQPFRRARPDEVVEAIRKQFPPPASEINPAVSQSIGRVVHKGMAKQPWHRFSSAREFSDVLNKALRNEPIEFFDPSRTRPRIERATKALEAGDYQFAGEILAELEAEGHIDNEIVRLRQQLDITVRRKTIAQLLDAAKARFEEQEDPLALQKIQDILEMEPDNAQALSLKSQIENRRSEKQIENWFRLARQHMDNHAYAHAREALQNVLQLRPQEGRALQLIAEVDRHELEYKKLRQEKTQIHRAAVEAWQNGDVSSALSKLAVVLELDRRAPDASTPERGATYQSFYNEVRSEHDKMNTAYAEARKQLAEHNFSKALAACEAYFTKYPNNAIFQALKYDIEEQKRQDLSSFIAAIDRQVEAEADLDKRVNILNEALERHPGEVHFERALRLVKDKRDLVNSIVARALHHEAEGAFGDALNDWEILRAIYSQYPGLKFEVERLQKRREQQGRTEARTGWVEQVNICMNSSDYGRALELLQRAKAEFPNDAELAALEKLAQGGVERAAEARRLMAQGQELCAQNRAAEGIKLLRQAYQLDEHDALSRAVLSNALLEQARAIAESDWQEADRMAQEVVELTPGHPLAKTVRALISDQKREQSASRSLSPVRPKPAKGDSGESTLSVFPAPTVDLSVPRSALPVIEKGSDKESAPPPLAAVTPVAAGLNQTIEMAHVLFMDIVAYSRLPMDEQHQAQRHLQEAIRETKEFARAQAGDQLIRLPTGDGMALVFLSDVEAPVRCALELHRILRRWPEMQLRMGIHTGPVYRVEDINAARNVAGGGINIAQRVMDCGDAGHILVSKSVADVLDQVSTWKTALHDLGEAEVKHGFRVHIYNFYTDEAGNAELPRMAVSVAHAQRVQQQTRILEAAAPEESAVGRSTEVVAMVRRTDFGGLREYLAQEATSAITPEDVHERPFELEFAVDAQDKVQPAEILLRLESPDFQPPSQTKKLRVPPLGNSPLCTFLIRPTVPGELFANLELLRGEEIVVSRRIKTRALVEGVPIGSGMNIVSIPLVMLVHERQAEFTRILDRRSPLAQLPPSGRAESDKDSAPPPFPTATPVTAVVLPPLGAKSRIKSEVKPGTKPEPKSGEKPAPAAKARPVMARPELSKAPTKASRGTLVAGGALGVILLLAFLLVGKHSRPNSVGVPPTVAQFNVRVHALPAGATIRVNGEVRGVSDLQVDLPGGTYQIEAQLPGYQPKTVTFDAKDGAPKSIELTLDPALAAAVLSSDTGTGKVSLDDQPPVDLQNTQWTLKDIAPGEHKLKFDGPQGSASFGFATAAGAAPSVTLPITAKGLVAVVVSNVGDRMGVFASDSAAKLSFDGQPQTAMGQDGWQFTQVTSGTHKLTLTLGSERHQLDVDAGPAPSLTVFLESGRNIGTLVVVTGEDKARVFLNGKLQKDTTQGGEMRISNLEPKDYVVRVSKDGFQDPPEQKVRILKGEERELTFNLQPVPRVGSLSIQGGTPGAQVLIDQTTAGTVQADGSFSAPRLSPGEHVVELRKEGFKTRRLQKRIVSGSNVAITSAEAALEVATGEIKIIFTPPAATVTLSKAGEAPISVSSGSPVSLQPGTYTLTARLDNLTRTSTVEVVAGQSKTLDLPLGPTGMTLWDDPAGWKRDAGTYVRKGGDFVLYSASPTSGTFVFSAQLQKGHRLQWVVNYVDEHNYILFEMDENNLYRSVRRNDEKTDEIKVPFKSEKKSFHTIQIHITPAEIDHHVKSGDNWVALDKLSGANLSAGKFGFYIHGSDQVVLSSFSRYAELSAAH